MDFLLKNDYTNIVDDLETSPSTTFIKRLIYSLHKKYNSVIPDFYVRLMDEIENRYEMPVPKSTGELLETLGKFEEITFFSECKVANPQLKYALILVIALEDGLISACGKTAEIAPDINDVPQPQSTDSDSENSNQKKPFQFRQKSFRASAEFEGKLKNLFTFLKNENYIKAGKNGFEEFEALFSGKSINEVKQIKWIKKMTKGIDNMSFFTLILKLAPDDFIYLSNEEFFDKIVKCFTGERQFNTTTIGRAFYEKFKIMRRDLEGPMSQRKLEFLKSLDATVLKKGNKSADALILKFKEIKSQQESQ